VLRHSLAQFALLPEPSHDEANGAQMLSSQTWQGGHFFYQQMLQTHLYFIFSWDIQWEEVRH